MNTKWVYEIIDLRKNVRKLPPVGEVRSRPGGLDVWTPEHSHPTFLAIDDEDPDALEDVEGEGRLEVRTIDGRIIFKKLGMEQAAHIYAMFNNVPDLKTDEDVQRYFLEMLR